MILDLKKVFQFISLVDDSSHKDSYRELTSFETT